jgi:hypothetical protein
MVNEHLLYITGSASLPTGLSKESLYNIVGGELAVYFDGEKDNNDGTVNRVYKARFMTPPHLVQGDTKIIGKDKTKRSVVLRRRIKEYQQELGLEHVDEDEFYTTFINSLLYHFDDVSELLVKLKQ